MLNVLIADDEPLARQTIKLLLKDQPDINEVFEAANGNQVLEVFNKNKPEIVFLDIQRVKRGYYQITPSLLVEDISQYKTFIEEQEKAWIRFSGPRINNGIQTAAFEVRIHGSKIDHPKQLHYIAIDQLDEIITPFEAGSTPFSLKLEDIPKDETEVETVTVESQNEEITEEVVTTEEVATETEVEISAPTSDDPKEWEAYLDKLELTADLEEEVIEDLDLEEDNDDSLFGTL